MFERLRKAAANTVTELQGHRALTRDIEAAVAAGDQEAADTFRTGTLAAALTARGRDARGEEISDYVDKVLTADGNADAAERLRWLHRRR
ncbi:hypothetical protein [Streptomyces sp. CBMA156]|uniref:hypothetical protein n=1 Tax=Streptomyces sp. CBMA156 TaxID=1930280 RepID=UPI001661F897|nr:hypothetical protein [Streptomyces sp. CBMA156]MBD0671619.1 hypothetical protein [Streptomyces sp. CBMA156]MBD0671629.1 hypothetical protein [Streptomyces sp. CBMA156]